MNGNLWNPPDCDGFGTTFIDTEPCSEFLCSHRMLFERAKVPRYISAVHSENRTVFAVSWIHFRNAIGKVRSTNRTWKRLSPEPSMTSFVFSIIVSSKYFKMFRIY
jgi:hypothetical protein